MNTNQTDKPTRDTYLAVLRLLPGLTTHELHNLRMFDVPSEQKRRRGIEVRLPAKEGDE